MFAKKMPRSPKGQTLVEYALIIGLVAIVVIVGVSAVGLAIQRVHAVILGSLGTKYNQVGHLEILNAQCIASASLGGTGLYVYGNTDENPADLTASSNLTVGTAMDGSLLTITSNGGTPNSFLLNRMFVNKADVSLCPISIVIQAKDGAIAEAPLTKVVIP